MKRFLRLPGTLSSKLTMTYGAMCAAVLIALYIVLRVNITAYAEQVATRDMGISSDTFQSELRESGERMQESANLLARDFGFRRAAATEDVPTVISALENLAARSDRPLALYVSDNGSVMGTVPVGTAQQAALHHSLTEQTPGKVLSIAGHAYGFVTVDVTAPTHIGWLVLGKPIDGNVLASAQDFRSRHLTARIVSVEQLPRNLRDPANALNTVNTPWVHDEDGIPMLSRVVLMQDKLGGTYTHALVIDFSMQAATAAYRELFEMIALVGFLGLLLLSAGCWLAARALTRPIAILERAVDQVSRGGRQPVHLKSTDEIGSLADSFNRMVGSISAHEAEIVHMALHDTLTGLPNRRALLNTLDAHIDAGDWVAVLALDLDDFKVINDSLGHPVGDGLLCAAAERLKAALPDHMIARFGGDEFVILVSGDPVAETAATVAERVQRELEKTFCIDGHNMTIGTSIGIAVAPDDGETADAMFKSADLALYRVKANVRGEYRFFEAGMDQAAQERRQLDTDMRTALTEGQFLLHFQPLLHLAKNRIASLEALIRWEHPERGRISPEQFIPLAEQNGQINAIGEWVIEEALARLQQWPESVSVAVNVSPTQFLSPTLVPFIEDALRRTGVDPKRLELEVTESVFIADLEETLSGLNGLRSLGVRVALDDFGTGFSSLSYLRKFSFDKLKIDRSFIEDLATMESAAKIVHAITDLAAAMGMETVAEGVEDEAQLALIRDQGCTLIQGYLFSKPLPADQIPALLATVNGEEAELLALKTA